MCWPLIHLFMGVRIPVVILDTNETSKCYNELKEFNVQQMNGGDLLKLVENQRKTKEVYVLKKWR